MARTYYVHCRCNRLPYCCGVIEAGDFDQSRMESSFHQLSGSGTNYKKAWASLLAYLLGASTRGKAVQFWFKKGPTAKNYQAAALRDLVMSLPGVVHLAEPYRNPSSGNTIDGWLIFNTGKIVIPTGEKSA